MKALFIFLFINLFFFTFSILPIWDLKHSSKDLLSSVNSYEYTITHRKMYDLIALLKKKITKADDGTITHQNTLQIDSGDVRNVAFENIESFYKKSDTWKLLCPIGSYDPINLNDLSEIPNNINKTSKWNLKCYNHNVGYFFTFYLNNGENQVYDLKSNNSYI